MADSASGDWPGVREGEDASSRARLEPDGAAYRTLARSYDLATSDVQPLRRQVVELLRLNAGDTVIDAGCGTGLCFPLIMDAVGPSGYLIGIEQSPEMLACAQERVKRHGWDNVDLICSKVEEAPVQGRADAALFCLTHDILHSPQAVANVLGALRPGARIAALGSKWASVPDLWWAPWMLPGVNVLVMAINRPYVDTFTGFDRPWRHLLPHVPDLQVRPALFGGAYLAWGTYARR